MNLQATVALSLPIPAEVVTGRTLTITDGGSLSLGPYTIPVDAASYLVPDPIADTAGSLTFAFTDTNATGPTVWSVTSVVPVTPAPLPLPTAGTASVTYAPFPA